MMLKVVSMIPVMALRGTFCDISIYFCSLIYSSKSSRFIRTFAPILRMHFENPFCFSLKINHRIDD